MKNFLALSIFSVFLLASCAAPESETAAVNSDTVSEIRTGETPEPRTGTAAASSSNKLDACEVLPLSDVGRILGQPVKSAELSRVTEGTRQTAAFSQCTYQTAAGQTVEFFARRSPVADNTREAIEKLRETMRRMGKLEEVGAQGADETAFWISGVNQLHVFRGEGVYLYFTLRNFKSSEDAKAKALELSRQVKSALSSRQ